MNSAFEFLKENPVFHFATIENNKPRVRPFGFIMKRDGALYMCTGKGKDVYNQIIDNPEIEISCMGKDGSWLRVRGTVQFDDTREAKAQAFEEAPNLLNIYPGGADNEKFITLFFTEAEATLYSFTADPKKIPLF